MGMSGTAVGAISEFLQPPLQQPTLPASPTLTLSRLAISAALFGRCLSILAWENGSLELI